MIYFTSDLHLGHNSVIALCHRPFSSTEEMDETLIANWNAKVKGNDKVYIVGDLIWDGKRAEEYLSRLRGKKVLIVGNHDGGMLSRIDVGKYFVSVSKYAEESIESRNITLCHYPLLEWKNSRIEGSVRMGFDVFGHVHNNVHRADYMPVLCRPTALNAGVDVNGFAPVTFGEMMKNNSVFKHAVLKGTDAEKLLTEREKSIAEIFGNFD